MLYDSGREPPAEFFEQPELTADDLPYWNAFHVLGTERQLGMSLGPIPWSKVVAYADYLDLDEHASERLHAIVRRVDGEYLSMLSPKSKDDEENKMRSKASMNDPKGIARVFSGLERRQKAVRGSKKK